MRALDGVPSATGPRFVHVGTAIVRGGSAASTEPAWYDSGVVKALIGLLGVTAAIGCGGSNGAGGGPGGSLGADASSAADAAGAADSTLGSDAAGESGASAAGESGASAAGESGASAAGDATTPCFSDAAACEGLECDVDMNCPDGGSTTVSGTVYDPAGRNPLSNAVVFVPRHPASLAPIETGTSSCNACGATIGDTLTVAASDATGAFTLRGAPTGDNVPLVIQVGKWRRVVQVQHVAACAETTVPPELTRLPRNQSEGDLPQMALLTGGCDNVACFLRSVGVDAEEFTAPHAGGRVDVYQGLGAAGPAAPLSGGTAGDCTTDACPLWSSAQSLESYDAAFLGCECEANNQTKPSASLIAMHDWLSEGGTVFATHSQATWFENGPTDFQGVANWTAGPASGALGPFAVDTTVSKGADYLQWLVNIGAASADGIVSLGPDVSTSVTTVSPLATGWLDDTSTASEAGGALSGNVKAFSFPVPVTNQQPMPSCGKVHFADIHPGGGGALQEPNADASPTPAPVPAVCDGGPLTAEETALEFFLFDQSICIATTVELPPQPCSASADGGGAL
jgi:hypothetical protein